MYTSAITATLALALFTFSPLTSAALLPRQNGISCQTSDGSPTTDDVTAVINQLKGKGGDCTNGNGKGSDCSTVVSHATAALSVCGSKAQISCADVANYATQVQQQCDTNQKVGGTYQVNAGLRVEVINSGGS